MIDNYEESDFWEPQGRYGRRDRSETYRSRREDRTGSGREDNTRTGKVILMFVSGLSSILVILGLYYATGAGARHKVALAAADCEPAPYVSGLPCITRQMDIARYEAIVTPSGKLLNADAAAYQVNERHNLVAAQAALTAAASAEQALDSTLATVTDTAQNRARFVALNTSAASNGTPVPAAATVFTPQMTVIANTVMRDLQTLAKLTTEQARSTSLTQMRSFNGRVAAATIATQAELKLLRTPLDTPPTVSQEP